MSDLQNNEKWATAVESLFEEINAYIQHLSVTGTVTEKFHAQVFSGILKKWNVAFSKSDPKDHSHLSLGPKYPLLYRYSQVTLDSIVEVANEIKQ